MIAEWLVADPLSQTHPFRGKRNAHTTSAQIASPIPAQQGSWQLPGNGGSAGYGNRRRAYIPHPPPARSDPPQPAACSRVGVVDWTYLFLRSSLLQVALEVAGWELGTGAPRAAALPDGCSRHECRRLGTDWGQRDLFGDRHAFPDEIVFWQQPNSWVIRAAVSAGVMDRGGVDHMKKNEAKTLWGDIHFNNKYM